MCVQLIANVLLVYQFPSFLSKVIAFLLYSFVKLLYLPSFVIFLAPTGALIVTVVYYRSAAASF